MSSRFQVLVGDMRQVLQTVPANSVDAIVTDPPYGLAFMGKGWDAQVPGPEYWREALRVAKPGAHLLAFGGTRTAHRLACAIEDAGWELRDCLSWLYGSGFPKSHDVSKAIDREAGAERTIVSRPGVKSGCSPDMNTYAPGLNAGFQQRELLAPATPAAAQWNGWGTALKPAWEPIYLARKPLVGTVASNVLAHGCGGLNVDGCRIETSETLGRFNHARTEGTSYVVQREDKLIDNSGGLGRWPANLCLDEWEDQVLRLKHDVQAEVARVIRLYFEGVSAVRGRDQDLSEQGGSQALLHSEVLPQGTRIADGGVVTSHGDQTHTRGVGENESTPPQAGSASPHVEGRALVDAGILGAGVCDVAGSRPSTVPPQALHYGAQTCDGTFARSPAPEIGNSAPLQRGQNGQSIDELGTARQRNAQARTSSDCEGIEGVASGERALEARASAIPAGWLAYFEPTGRFVRCGAAAMLDEQTGVLKSGALKPYLDKADSTSYGMSGYVHNVSSAANEGGASRFFYVAKASRSEREAGLNGNGARANTHPTVKPIALMRWLVRLITPPGGIVLDPFAGSGTTGCAALLEGMRFLGIELQPEFRAIAEARITHMEAA